MATERKVAPLAAFFKFTTLGQKVVGKLVEYKEDKDRGPFVVMSPVAIVRAPGGQPEMWKAVTVGLSTDLRLKVTRQDRGKFLSLEYVDYEPTTKESNKKLFRVLELTREELVQAVDGADRSHREELYTAAASAADSVDTDAFDDRPLDDDDDLPF